jgi:hypothetical protein
MTRKVGEASAPIYAAVFDSTLYPLLPAFFFTEVVAALRNDSVFIPNSL